MTAVTLAPHLWQDEAEHIFIDDTRFKVIILVQLHLAQGLGAEALHEQFPDLSLAQIYAALAYFYDHKEDCERQIAAEEREVAALLDEMGESDLQVRLRRLEHSK